MFTILDHLFYPLVCKYGMKPKQEQKFYMERDYNDRQLRYLHFLLLPPADKLVNQDWSEEIMADWKFFNRKLNSKEKEDFLTWMEDSHSDIEIYLPQTLNAGFKLSVSGDPINEAFTASLSPTKSNTGWVKGSLVAKHAEYYTAMCMVLWKHCILCKSRSWDSMETGRENDWG